MKYDSKVSTLEERNDLDIVTVDEIHGVLTAYEMRMGKNDHSKISDDEEALFIKKLERGTRKYKGKLPLKCFNCGRIRHFASKCPYSKQDDSDKREVSKKFKKGKKGNKKKII